MRRLAVRLRWRADFPRWLAGAALACALAFTAYAAPSVSANLDRQTVSVGETLTLTLTFEEAAPASAPALPALQKLSFQGVAQSSQISILNGVQKMTQSYSYTLAATQPGDVLIPSIQAAVGGRVLATQPLRVKIVPAEATGAAQDTSAFLKLLAPKTEVFLGEPFAVDVHLYFQDAQDVRMPQINAEGFSFGQPAKPQQTTTAVGGVGYHLVLFKYAATAARAGDLTLGPATCELNLRVPVRTRARDPFDPFGFFGARVQLRAATLSSDPLPIKVLPLPTQNVPPTFNGAVGKYQLAVQAGPTNVTVGDPITVRVQISGQGLIDSVTLPTQPDWRDFKTYPATATVSPSDELGLNGTKTFEQVVVPQNHEITALPSFQFSYFDPETRQYQTLRRAPVALTVRPSATAVVPPPMLTNTAPNTPPPVDDIVHIHPRLEASEVARPWLLGRPWFWVVQGVPLVSWLALLFTRRRAEALANNPRLRRQREVAVRVQEGLRDLRLQAEAQKSDDFFATLFRVLQEQIGERLDVPASAITEAVVEERLRTGHLSPETLGTLQELFQACNQARYAPVQSRQELAAFIPRAEAAVRALQDFKA